MISQNIRIKLRAFDVSILERAGGLIREAAMRSGATASGPFPLPIKSKRFVLLRSPHVNKKSQEKYALITHTRIIDIQNLNDAFRAELSKLTIPEGVDVQVDVK
jgi:small subunit ribosomal protein S10